MCYDVENYMLAPCIYRSHLLCAVKGGFWKFYINFSKLTCIQRTIVWKIHGTVLHWRFSTLKDVGNMLLGIYTFLIRKGFWHGRLLIVEGLQTWEKQRLRQDNIYRHRVSFSVESVLCAVVHCRLDTLACIPLSGLWLVQIPVQWPQSSCSS